MDNNTEPKKSNTFLVVLVIILIMLVLALTGYIVYDAATQSAQNTKKSLRSNELANDVIQESSEKIDDPIVDNGKEISQPINNEEKNQTKINDQVIDNAKEIKETPKSTTTTIPTEISKLYSILTKVDNITLPTYGENKITLTDLDENAILKLSMYGLKQTSYGTEALCSKAIYIMDMKEADITKYDEGQIDIYEGITICRISWLSEATVLNQAKRIFGKTPLFTNNKLIYYAAGFVSKYIKDDRFDLYTFVDGQDGPIFALAFNNAKIYDNRIEVYDYYLYGITMEENKLYLIDFSTLEYSKKLEYVKKYGKQYKHTFNKNTDGTYYWVSSEPVE